MIRPDWFVTSAGRHGAVGCPRRRNGKRPPFGWFVLGPRPEDPRSMAPIAASGVVHASGEVEIRAGLLDPSELPAILEAARAMGLGS